MAKFWDNLGGTLKGHTDALFGVTSAELEADRNDILRGFFSESQKGIDLKPLLYIGIGLVVVTIGVLISVKLINKKLK